MLSYIDPGKFNTLIVVNALIASHYEDVHALLTRILESAMRLCEGDAASLLIVNRELKNLRFEIALGPKGQEVKRYTVKIGEGIAGWVAMNNQPIIVNNPRGDERHRHDIPLQIGYPANNILAVPMRLKDECIGVIEVLNKQGGGGFSPEDLEWLEIFANQAALALNNALSFEQANSEIQLLHDKISSTNGFHTMIGKSPVVLHQIDIINRVAQTDSSVLILGESGVGKEIFAEQIHLRSQRRDTPFVRVNCAALPEGLLESELFGHVKGAFTSAVANRQGRFEAANGGTIFLDEIGDMPLSLQAKILRVIQEKAFEKVGSDTTVTVDVRILAATNKNIEELVEKGQFRSDLYYRLNVVPLYIPPLRERTEDIPELARFFLSKFMRENKKHFEGFSAEALAAMLSYSWPGNVRELENCIERVCVIGRNNWIQRADLFPKTGADTGESEGGQRALKNTLNVFKSNFIRTVLEENKWSQTEAARVLDIQRTYLSKLIKELDIKLEKGDTNVECK